MPSQKLQNPSKSLTDGKPIIIDRILLLAEIVATVYATGENKKGGLIHGNV